MLPINKGYLRLAIAIHSQLLARRQNEPLLELPIESWERCAQLVRQIRRAQLRGWNLAQALLRNDLRRAIPSVQSELTTIYQRLPNALGTDHFPTVRNIYQDIVALDEEFEELAYDLAERRLSVTTESIELEGVYLGPFEIRLCWGPNTPTYRVIATDPHPADSRDNVTHPHVMDGVLCEGDGRHAIRQAIVQGRLFDFFILIAGVLRNYNSESPYVELALWQGTSCSDCGALVDDDDCYSCQMCGAAVCGGCESVCCTCDEISCSDCISSCARCDDNNCHRCLKRCDHCQERVCADCLDEHERCPNCHEEDDSSEEDETDNNVASAKCAAI